MKLVSYFYMVILIIISYFVYLGLYWSSWISQITYNMILDIKAVCYFFEQLLKISILKIWWHFQIEQEIQSLFILLYKTS